MLSIAQASAPYEEKAPPSPDEATRQSQSQSPGNAPALVPVAVPVEASVELIAPYRTIQVTFGDGPMGIDLKVMEGSDPLAQAMHGPKGFSEAEPKSVIAVRRTIGQAQVLGLLVGG
jgi:hypothetical protein